MTGLLDWSRSAFGRQYGFGVAAMRSLRKGSDGGFGSGSGELVYDTASRHVIEIYQGSNFDHYSMLCLCNPDFESFISN